MTLKASSDKQPSIIIVGGGMVGMSLALLLSRSSLKNSITLIEQYSLPLEAELPQWQPSFDDRSTALSAGSQSILEKMGCWPALSEQVETIQRVHVSDRGHFGGAELKAADYDLAALGYVIANRWLGQVLISQLRQSPVEVLAPAKVKACRPVAGGYELQLAEAEQALRADLLLIADGAESELRQRLGIETERHNYRQSAMIANVVLDSDHQGAAYERFTADGPIALLPLPDFEGQHQAALVWTLPEQTLAEVETLPKTELLRALQKRFGFRAGNIIDIGETQVYPLNLVQACEQVRSNLVVLGNAAHFLHPVAGQGFNLALRDCTALVDVLQQAQLENMELGSLSVLNRYQQVQQQDQFQTITMTDSLVKLFSTRSLPLSAFRQLGLISMQAAPMVKDRFARIMMGVA